MQFILQNSYKKSWKAPLATTKQCNTMESGLFYHSNHPHHQTGSLRGRLGVRDHLGEIPAQ